MASFSPKDPTEIITIGFNYSTILTPSESISSATFAVTVVSGSDPSPGLILQGAAILSYEPLVRQNIQGGTNGVIYHITCTANTDESRTLVEAADMTVRTA